MEKITEINEITDGEGYSTMSGYEVVTNDPSIKLLIDDQQCCANHSGIFGAMMTPANLLALNY